MFENLSERLTKTLRFVTGQAKLTEDNIKDTLREVRMALLEADVALPVVKEFVNSVKERAVGVEVSKSLTPGQVFVKIVNEELVRVMGEANEALNLAATPPAVVLMAGLQGAGKTTSVAKLSRLLKDREKKKVLVVSADVYRPAAIKQLETLAAEVGVDFFPSSADQDPIDIARAAIQHAKIQHHDVLLVDTAGRLHVDSDMMDEIKRLHAAINPIETLFVVDAMTGQDAANTARSFNEVLPLTGVILTKADGDARGGAALSVRHITGKPIKFIGMGEKIDALEPFYPDRLASRILGMGDVLSLIEEAERKIDKDKAEKFAAKIKKGKGFDLEDILEEIVGELSAEHREENSDIHPQEDGSYFIEASAYIREINKSLSWELPTDGPKTLNGLIIETLEAIPDANVCLQIANYRIETLQMSDNLIKSARIIELPKCED